jgi:hypothetical protein
MANVQVINSHLNLKGHRIGALGDPESAREAATKAYVDRAVALVRGIPTADPMDGVSIWNDEGVLKTASVKVADKPAKK